MDWIRYPESFHASVINNLNHIIVKSYFFPMIARAVVPVNSIYERCT